MASHASPMPRAPKARQRPGDRIFAGSARGAGIIILITLAAVSIFLLAEGYPALVTPPEEISILDEQSFTVYVTPLVFGTLWAAALALLMAFPVAIGIALIISHSAPRRIAVFLGYVVDLLAAVPSSRTRRWTS